MLDSGEARETLPSGIPDGISLTLEGCIGLIAVGAGEADGREVKAGADDPVD